jgi:hypothetical protein
MPKTNIRVTCIRKANPKFPGDCISHIGGVGWTHTCDQAILYIERGICEYWLTVDGRAVRLTVARAAGEKELKAEIDCPQSETLLGLPECGDAR